MRRLAVVARALTWERAISTSRQQSEPVDSRYENATLETLAGIVED